MLNYQRKIITIIIMTSMLGIFISDIYIPSIINISDYFAIDKRLLSSTITYYFIVFAFLQLLYGPLSDRFGRRKIFLTGLFISIIGTIFTLFSININMFIFGRTLQALGMASPMSLGRVILRDIIIDQYEYSRIISFMGIIILFTPVVAPIFGACLEYLYYWRADFIFIIVINLISFIMAYLYLSETLFNKKRNTITELLNIYLSILNNKIFIKNIIISSMTMGTNMGYLSLSSLLFQNYFGFNEIHSSILFGITELFIPIGMLINGIYFKYYNITKSQKISVLLFLFSGIFITIQTLVFNKNIFLIILGLMIFNFSSGIIFPTSSALAMILFKNNLGIVGSLYGCIIMLTSGLISIVILFFPFSPNILFTILILSTSIIANSALFYIKD